MENQDNKKGLDTNLYILKALESGEKYGYEIIDAINKISRNELSIKQATLYTNLKKLEQKKLISSYWKDSEIGGKRHYYYITENGLTYLKDSNYNFSTFKEIMQDGLDDDSIQVIDIKDINNKKESKAFWNENQFLTNNIKKDENSTTFIDIPKDENQTSQKNEPQKTIVEDLQNKSDARILGQDEVISTSYAAISMENRPYENVETDIDYKSILGELYSNKENIKKEKQSQNIVQEDIVVPNIQQQEVVEEDSEPIKEDENERKVDTAINIKTTAHDFSNYKIKVKQHNKLYNVDISSNEYLKSSKLNLFLSIISFGIFSLFLLIAGLIIDENVIDNSTTVLLTSFGVSAIFPIIMLGLYFINPDRKIKNDFNFKNLFTIIMLTCSVLLVFIIAICLLCGMTNMNQDKYLFVWLLPLLLSFTAILYPITKVLLIKSKKFDC